jgi:hypothetical protein
LTDKRFSAILELMSTKQQQRLQKKRMIILFGIVILLGVGVLIVYGLWRTKGMKNTKPHIIDLKQYEVPSATEAVTSIPMPHGIVRAPSITPSAIWKVYTTADFSIQYPANWFIDEYITYNSKNEFAMEIADVPNVIHVYGSPLPHPNQDIEVFYYAMGIMPKEISDPYRKINTAKPININGYKGLQGNTSGEPNGLIDEIDLANPKGGYVVIRQYIGDTDIFNRIVATFKFT